MVAFAWGRDCSQPLDGVSGTAWVAVRKAEGRGWAGWVAARQEVCSESGFESN